MKFLYSLFPCLRKASRKKLAKTIEEQHKELIEMARRNPIRPLPAGSFEETFSTGILNPSVWTVSNYSGSIGSNTGHVASFSSANVDLSQGMLRLKLDQAGTSGNYTSSGAEIYTQQSFGYGTYRFIFRASSTSVTPYGSGSAVEGTISGLFNFVNNSETEIDFEVEGIPSRKNNIYMTNWIGPNWPDDQTSTVFEAISPEASFYDCRFVWTAGKVDYYINEQLRASHTTKVPSAPAPIFINHWGTNNVNFGGLPTVNTPRYLYVSYVSFIPA